MSLFYVYLGGDYAGMYEGPAAVAIEEARKQAKEAGGVLWSEQLAEAEEVVPGAPTSRPISRKVLA